MKPNALNRINAVKQEIKERTEGELTGSESDFRTFDSPHRNVMAQDARLEAKSSNPESVSVSPFSLLHRYGSGSGSELSAMLCCRIRSFLLVAAAMWISTAAQAAVPAVEHI